jgi:M6 family metalloprotease-like protein
LFALRAAVAALVLVPRSDAQDRPFREKSQMHPRWELPGLDFRQNGAWRVRARAVAARRAQLLASGNFALLNAGVQQRGAQPTLTAAAVTGTQLVPALLISYQGVGAQFMRPATVYDSLLFGGVPPNGNPYTLRTFYEQMSDTLFSMQGKVMGWVVLDSAEVTYTGTPGPSCVGNGQNCNGLFSSDAIRRMQNGFRQALTRVDTGASGINFGQFDNDGPDGVPNSGDDDGYVDMMMFAHATKDGACVSSTNNHIWSHRYSLLNANQSDYQDYVTNDAKLGGGSIKISDYFASSALGGGTACDSTQIMAIGTSAHEFGHALGLPDLYDTQGPTEGIGRWSLMGSGNFSSPFSPARMDAWSLNQLGWVSVASLNTSGTYSVDAAPVSDTAFYVNVQGTNTRGEYFLIQNRQPAFADTALIRHACQVWYQQQSPPPCPGGLLLLHIDGAILAGGGNLLNAGPIHAVKVEEADGARDLWCPGAVPEGCNRGDAGDLYPGLTNNTVFSVRTNPAAVKNLDGSFVGFAVDSIRQVVAGGTMAFRLRFGGVTVVRGSDSNAAVQVDGVNYTVFRDLYDDGTIHTISIADTQFAQNQRTRWRFASWSDAGARTHTITGAQAGATYTATLNRDFKIIASATTGGSISSTPTVNLAGEFIAEGNGLQLTATPNSGVTFAGWSGDTSSTNPVITLPMGRPYTVTANFLTTADVVTQLLGPGSPLSPAQWQALDQNGNNNGVFDVGDFLAWVKATGAPLSADVMARLSQRKGGRP